MRRRAFIAALGGAAAWPFTARAQQTAKLPTIGFLGSATPSTWGPWITVFVQRLRELGWTEGRNVAIEVRWGEGRSERFTEIAAEFVRLRVDVIVTGGNAALAAKQATSVIPIVFAVAADPVGSGLVGSLARPGSNVTGLSMGSADVVGKRLELLREVVPSLHRLAIMANAGYSATVLEMNEAQKAARALSLESVAVEIRRNEDIAPAFETSHQGRCARTLCVYRSARELQLGSHQYPSAWRTAANDARCSGICRSGRTDVLWSKLSGPVPACR